MSSTSFEHHTHAAKLGNYQQGTGPVELERLLRKKQIIGDKAEGITPIIPVSEPTWDRGVKSGRFPQPVSFGGRAVFWRESEIHALIESMKGGH